MTSFFIIRNAKRNIEASSNLDVSGEPSITITNRGDAPGSVSISVTESELLQIAEAYAKAKADHIPF